MIPKSGNRPYGIADARSRQQVAGLPPRPTLCQKLTPISSLVWARWFGRGWFEPGQGAL